MCPRNRGGKAAAHLLANIYVEILCWLSCTQLSKLRFVCKDWLDLISSPEFIKKHQEKLFKAPASSRTRLILTSSCHGKIRQYGYDEGKIHVINKGVSPIPIPNPNNRDLLILGSCDGLVLCKVGDDKIALFNPCTGMTDTRDDLLVRVDGRRDIIYSWFGHHPSTQEYVLVLVSVDHGESLIFFQVYSLSGTTINTTAGLEKPSHWYGFTKFRCTGTSLNGRLYFPIMNYILRYDFESNALFNVMPPTKLSRDITLGVVGGYLSVTMENNKGVFEVFVMKEEGWSKCANIEGYGTYRNLTPIAYFWNGEVVFEGDDLQYIGGSNKIISLYSFRDMETKQYCEGYADFGGKDGAIACVESLVTPAMVWRGGNHA